MGPFDGCPNPQLAMSGRNISWEQSETATRCLPSNGAGEAWLHITMYVYHPMVRQTPPMEPACQVKACGSPNSQQTNKSNSTTEVPYNINQPPSIMSCIQHVHEKHGMQCIYQDFLPWQTHGFHEAAHLVRGLLDRGPRKVAALVGVVIGEVLSLYTCWITQSTLWHTYYYLSLIIPSLHI